MAFYYNYNITFSFLRTLKVELRKAFPSSRYNRYIISEKQPNLKYDSILKIVTQHLA